MKILFSTLLLILSLSFLGTVWTYEAIFSFGDSHSDTGNRLLSKIPSSPNPGKLPYGETFFHHPTGRFSNGRLIVDFFAEAFGLPYLQPNLGLVDGKKYVQGINFAMAGATALEPEFFTDLGQPVHTNFTLSVQVGMFKTIKSSLCTTKQNCDNYFKNVLFLVGEIGGVDFDILVLELGFTIKQARATVSLVIDKIVEATSMLIEEGAVELVVPGNFPLGCSGQLLALFQSPYKSDDYDQINGCLKAYNTLSVYYNDQLKIALDKLQGKYPHTRIIYADQYAAAMTLIIAPKDFGFTNGGLRACCGGGGQYNFNISSACGGLGSITCADPSTYVSWDGIHLTESAYRYIAYGLINGPYASPPILSPSIHRLTSTE